jgi:tetratricopeptide (TPR) repeat protein
MRRLIAVAAMLGALAAVAGRSGADDRAEAQAQYEQGLANARAGRNDAAIALFENAVRLDPANVAAQFQLGNSLAIAGRYAAAVATYTEAVRLDPHDPRSRLALATALKLDGRCLEARDALRDGLRAVARDLGLIHALARLLVTCDDAEVRDGQRAIELARVAYAGASTLEVGETLAMAHAASGAFEEAVRLQAELMAKAEQAGDATWAARLRSNLERYQRGDLAAASP